MKSANAFALLVPAVLMLSGCDWFSGVGSSSDTKMTNVEILPGTASDEMITLDQASGDGTAIDTTVQARPGEPDRPGGTEDSTEADSGDTAAGDDADGVANDAEAPRPGDTVIRPPAESTKR